MKVSPSMAMPSLAGDAVIGTMHFSAYLASGVSMYPTGGMLYYVLSRVMTRLLIFLASSLQASVVDLQYVSEQSKPAVIMCVLKASYSVSGRYMKEVPVSTMAY